MSTDDTTTDKRVVLTKTVAITALAAISFEVALVLYGTVTWLGGDQSVSSYVPWTFHTLWEVAFLILAVSLAIQLGAKGENFFIGIMVGGVVSAIAWIFLPDPLTMLYPRYLGVHSRFTLETHEEGRYGEEEYDSPLDQGYLYHRNDPELKSEFRDRADYNEFTGARGFLFWQTGLANGYDPSLIDEYNGGKGVLSFLELFVTVGPLVIVEAVLRGLTQHFPIFLIGVGLVYARWKENIWFDLSKQNR